MDLAACVYCNEFALTLLQPPPIIVRKNEQRTVWDDLVDMLRVPIRGVATGVQQLPRALLWVYGVYFSALFPNEVHDPCIAGEICNRTAAEKSHGCVPWKVLAIEIT